MSLFQLAPLASFKIRYSLEFLTQLDKAGEANFNKDKRLFKQPPVMKYVFLYRYVLSPTQQQIKFCIEFICIMLYGLYNITDISI